MSLQRLLRRENSVRPIGGAQGTVETAQHTRAARHVQQRAELLVGERGAQTRADRLSGLRIRLWHQAGKMFGTSDPCQRNFTGNDKLTSRSVR